MESVVVHAVRIKHISVFQGLYATNIEKVQEPMVGNMRVDVCVAEPVNSTAFIH